MRTKPILQAGLLVLLSLFIGTGCSQKSKVARHLTRAESYFKEGDLEKAKIEFLNVLRLDRTNALAFVRLGSIFFDQGAVQQAYPFLARSKELAPQELDNRVKLGHILLSRSEAPKAREEALAILAKQPTHDEAILLLTYSSKTEAEMNDTRQRVSQLAQQTGPRASHHLSFANFLFRGKNIPAAEAEIRKALALDPKSFAAHLALGNLMLSQTNLVQAGNEFKTAAELSPPRHMARIRYVEFVFQQNTNVAPGVKILNEYLAATPDFLSAKRLLAQVAVAEKRHEDALKQVDELLRLDPLNYDSQMLRGNVFLAMGDLPKALEAYEKIDKTFSPSPEVKFQLALVNLLDRKLPKVVPFLDQAIKLDPENPEAVRLRGQLELRMGDPAKAASGILPLAKKRPEDATLQLLLAECYLGMGRNEEAMQIYSTVTKRYPGNLEAWMAAGFAFRQQDRPAEARGVFEHIRKIAPEHLPSLYQLVEIELNEKAYAKALAWVTQQKEDARKSAPSLLLEGRIYAAQGDWAKAEAVLRKALEADANLTPAYYLLATVFTQSKQQDKAVRQLEELIAKNPKEERGLMLLGMLQHERQEYKSAQSTYERLLAINPAFVPALNNLAILCAEQLNQPERAYEFAQKARQLLPEDPSIADTLGWILFQQRKYAEALPLLKDSANKFRNNGEVLFHLGMTYYMLTQEAPARTALQAALKTTTQFKGRDEAKQRLDILNRTGVNLSENSLLELAQQHPDDPFCKMALAELYENQKNVDKAARAYQSILDTNPKAVQALNRMALLYAGPLQDKAKALDFAKRARDLAPDDPSLAATYGQMAYLNGDFVLAYNLLRESAAGLTNRADVLHQFGWAAYSVGREAEGVAAMERSMALRPEAATAESIKWFLAMTAAYRNPTSLPDAPARAAELVKSAPTHVPGLMVIGANQMEKGDRTAAKATFEKVAGIYPEFHLVRKPLAILYAEDPATESKAYEMARKLREVMPNDLDLTSLMGRLSYRKQDFAAAALYLQQVVTARPQDMEAHYYLGLSYAKQKQAARAKESLQRALTLGLKDPLAKEARRVLGEVQAN